MASFSQRVLNLVQKIPRGRVATYKELARALGNPGFARAVGNALSKNPHLIKIPCHRVVCSNGRVGGYASGRERKKKLLEEEGIEIVGETIDLRKYGFSFK